MAKGGRRAHSGRKRKPTEMKVIQGTFRGDRHAKEPVVSTKWPDPPAHLNARELEMWRSLEQKCWAWVAPSDFLAVNGVVSLVDRLLATQEAQRSSPMAGYPLSYEERLVKENGELVSTIEAKENPRITLEIKLWRELRAYIGIMGLSPVDRARVEGPGGRELPAKDPLDRFINRKRV